MNEILSDTKAVLLSLFGFIGTLLGVLGVVVMSILRRHIQRIDKLEAECVRRSEFDQLRAILRDEHAENGGKLDGIAQSIREDRGTAEKHRESVRDSLEQIRTDIAVLKAEPLFDDAGRIRR